MDIFCLLLSKVSQKASSRKCVKVKNTAQELSYSGGEEFQYEWLFWLPGSTQLVSSSLDVTIYLLSHLWQDILLTVLHISLLFFWNQDIFSYNFLPKKIITDAFFGCPFCIQNESKGYTRINLERVKLINTPGPKVSPAVETVAAMWSLLQSITSILWSLPYLSDPLMRQDLQFAERGGEGVQAGDPGNTQPLSVRSSTTALEEIAL